MTPAASSSDGASDAPPELDVLFAAVYDELRRLARARLRTEVDGHTLNTTALVHEAYLRMTSQRRGLSANREQFFALAARAMRRILVDHARKSHAQKRPTTGRAVSLTALDAVGSESTSADDRAELLIALDDALAALAELDARLARVVEYRYFVGLTERETAELLGVTPRTVTRDWVRARAWLMTRLEVSGPNLE
jgi:RNA polymerase sigma factor (TIGR02999 family)